MLKIKMNSWFKPSWLGGDAYQSLKRARVEYETGKGFRFTSATDVRRAVTVLEEALKEKVEVEGFGKGKPCFICGKPLDEKEGELRTICDECLNNDDAYSLYILKFQELMDAV
ncbi:MAG: hypothetical protein JRN52_06350 [Nitrososphaerota archaeon]|nr:hypothetical protein [Nitrososphaerota archaeon]